MARIVNQKQQKNLNRFGIEIQTKYLDGERYIVKSTSEKNNDNQSIENGIILEKLFFLNGMPVKRLSHYDSRVQYRFITAQEEESDTSCPNCGYSGKGREFVDGCPYCNTFFNIEYADKNLGTKYYYDLVMKSDGYLKMTCFVSLFFSLLVMLVYIMQTGRTFNGYDMAKVIVGGILAGTLIFAVFYVLDAFIITLPVKYIKEKQNKEQRMFWSGMQQKGIDKKKLFNNFIYELSNLLYENPKIIDYNIVDYVKLTELLEEEGMRVSITVNMRLVFCENGQITMEEVQKTFVLEKKKIETFQLKEGINIIKCPHCGSSINAVERKCAYCGTGINRLQEWYLKLGADSNKGLGYGKANG